jgi:hypothetical protein
MPLALAISATAAMSNTCRPGLDGVSRKKTFVFGVIAARHASRSPPSTSVDVTPNFGRMEVRIW